MKNIAVIPARSGSKGLPDKNIKPVNGKPLLAYTIEAALESGCFDTVHGNDGLYLLPRASCSSVCRLCMTWSQMG